MTARGARRCCKTCRYRSPRFRARRCARARWRVPGLGRFVARNFRTYGEKVRSGNSAVRSTCAASASRTTNST